jgi:hypothetical protein
MAINKIQSSINRIIQRFSENPYYYFYEEDIRVELGMDLLSEFEKTSCTHYDRIIKTSPIKFEYPSQQSNKQRHDIVLLKPESSNNIYKLELSSAIELKLGSRIYDRCSDFKEDIRKLLGYSYNEFIGVALYFYQDVIDSNLFNIWFNDIVESFESIRGVNNIKINYGLNTFIILPSEILKVIKLKI